MFETDKNLDLEHILIQILHPMCLVMGGTPLPFKGRQACQPHIKLFFGFAPPSCIHKTKHRKGEKIAFQWPKVVSGILLQALDSGSEKRKVKVMIP